MRAPLVVIAAFLFALSAAAQAQQQYRVLSVNTRDLQKALDAATEARERIVAGDAGMGLIVLEKSDSSQRYFHTDDVEKFVNEKKVEPGFVVLPQTFGNERERRFAANHFGAIFQKVDGDTTVREYRLVKAKDGDALAKAIAKVSADGFRPLAVAAGAEVAVLVERTQSPPTWTVVSATRTGTLEKEVASAAGKGFRLVSGMGRDEAVYALEQSQGSTGPVDYKLFASARTTTVEKELNAAVQNGYRLVPGSLLGMQKMFLGNPAQDPETVVVMERRPDEAPATYRVLGTRRSETLEKELNVAAAEGFRLAAVSIGFKEIVAVLSKP